MYRNVECLEYLPLRLGQFGQDVAVLAGVVDPGQCNGKKGTLKTK